MFVGMRIIFFNAEGAEVSAPGSRGIEGFGLKFCRIRRKVGMILVFAEVRNLLVRESGWLVGIRSG